MTTESTKCACNHCNCLIPSGQGVLSDNLLYCCAACATHDHEHPGDCCVASACCA